MARTRSDSSAFFPGARGRALYNTACGLTVPRLSEPKIRELTMRRPRAAAVLVSLGISFLACSLAFGQSSVREKIAALDQRVAAAQSSADNSWMLVSAALVLLMTGPGLALWQIVKERYEASRPLILADKV